MQIVNLKYKYILAFILLLGIFICGYNFKQWYVTNHRVEKHISLLYSYAADEISRLNFEKLLKQEFLNQGIEPIFDTFYLDCNHTFEHHAISRITQYLEQIKNRPIDLILAVGDQATHSLLSTRHKLLNFVPVVGCNVRFPNEKLINEYIHLVRSAAVQMRGMASGYAQEEDLVNQGVLALMDCLERYDETRGAKFETFAFLRVRGSLIDFIRSQDWVPHRARSLQRHIEEAFRQLANEKMREPEAAEVAAYMGLPTEKIESHLQYMDRASILSFEGMMQDAQENASRMEPESPDLSLRPEESYCRQELTEVLARAVEGLTEKERLVITLYYYEELKYADIARVLDVVESRVCQIHTKAVKKLRDSLREYMEG